MHDIVRDFTVTAHTSSELQQLQHSFAVALVDSATGSDKSKGASAIQSYAHTLLSYHVRAGVVTPLSNDAALISWIAVDPEDPDRGWIAYQALQGVETADVEELAVELSQTKKFLSSGRVWFTLATTSRGLNKGTLSRYLRMALGALKQDPQIESTEMQVRTRQSIARFGDQQVGFHLYVHVRSSNVPDAG